MRRLAAWFLMISACALPQTGKVRYSFRANGTAFAVGINDRGQVLAQDDFNDTDSSLSTTDWAGLQFVFQDKKTGRNGSATALNTRNQFVGQLEYTEDTPGALFLFQNGVNGGAEELQLVDHPGADSIAQVNGINDAGAIVGAYFEYGRGDYGKGVLYDHGKRTSINFPGSVETIPYGINDTGTIVGRFLDTNMKRHWFIYQGDKYVQFDVPDAIYTEIRGVNNLGELAGNYVGLQGATRGFVRSSGRVITINYPEDIPRTISLSGINEEGLVSGSIGDIGFVATPSYLSGF